MWGSGEGAEVGREKAKRLDTRAGYLPQFLSLFHEAVLAGLNGKETEQVRQFLRAGIAMALYCEKDERKYHMFRVFLWRAKYPVHI